jgi:(p)ppGpp synthase/HD superfamily hydrolase
MKSPVKPRRSKSARGPLGKRFHRALVYASQLHATQFRKGTIRPYVAHLLGVTSIVLSNGGNEDDAIAALLHDAVEDQGGKPVLRRIRKMFGARVAAIVEGCTDADTIPKPPWRARKEKYIRHLRSANASVRLISAADKLYNAQETLADARILGDKVWKRFHATREETLWYYGEVLNILKRKGPLALAAELERVVEELAAVSNSATTAASRLLSKGDSSLKSTL